MTSDKRIKKRIMAGDFEVHVTKRPGQKNIYIRVSPPNGEITVSAPAKISDKLIKNFILGKIPEITKVRERMRKQFRQSEREYVSGETCYFWGVPYMLQVIYEGRRCMIQRVPERIIMTVPEGTPLEKRKSLLTEWYRCELKHMLGILLPECVKRVGVKINSCNIRNMKTRWGSCNISRERILINLQLVKKPPECLEYVLTHELVHLLEKNHTNRFKSLMDKYYPAWREAKRILAEMPLDHLQK
ncbi:MAG: M48 family metallopeptidase [Synergistaceae bacterium]|nr:M48 family metallopeptidase [Synergistaceae bacterium]